MDKLSLRDKSIFVGLYLSKFDKLGLKILGFASFTEAWNTMGLSLGVSPTSIKNYRDEFDPLFPNIRKGWHKRAIRQYCKNIFDKYNSLNIDEFSSLLKKMIYGNDDLEILKDEINEEIYENSSFAKRLVTGRSAEQYFRQNYKKIKIFKNYELEDTTKYGCGFDFKLHSKNENFLGIEVKGLNDYSGSIRLTSKEFTVAKIITDRYFLFVVKNFKEKPFHNFYQNPINSFLKFKKTEVIIKQNYWTSTI